MKVTENSQVRLPPLPPPLNPPSATNGKPVIKSKGTKQTSNRFRQINSFVDFSMAGLTRAEALTWLVLWRDTKSTGTAKTSSTDIARRIGVSRRAVTTALAKLRNRGLIRLVHQGGMNRGMSVYRVEPLVPTKG